MTEPTTEETSDADLRSWAKDNGIEDVPTSGKLSVSWREKIVNAMAKALDPKEEASAPTTSTTSSTPKTETKSEGEPWIADPAERAAFDAGFKKALDKDLEAIKEEEPEPEPYRTPWVAPDTWVTGQAYTA